MNTDELLAFVDKCLVADRAQRYDLAIELVTLWGKYALEAINEVLTKQNQEVR